HQTPHPRQIAQPADPVALPTTAPAARPLLRAPNPLSDLPRRQPLPRRDEHPTWTLQHPPHPRRELTIRSHSTRSAASTAIRLPTIDSTSIAAVQHTDEFEINSSN
ncbi:MAG: hypothetical protein ACLP50_13765, partial [Solirubrobacteraceae bacterium]